MEKPNLRKVLFYCLGVFVLALGVSVSIRSGLGVSPNSSVPYTISLITGLDNGLCQTLVFILFVLIQWVVLRRDFKPYQWLQVVTSVLFGSFVSLTTSLIFFVPTPEGIVGRVALSLLGSFFVGTGVFFYLATGIIPMSAEGLAQMAANKTGKGVPNAKLVLDCIMVLTSALLGLIFLKSPLASVGAGTILAAVLVSRFMALHERLYGRRYRDFLSGKRH